MPAENTTPPWDITPTAGPKGLLSLFVYHTLDDRLPALADLDDQTRTLLMDAVDVAIDLLSNALNIPDTWDHYYQKAINPKHQSQ